MSIILDGTSGITTPGETNTGNNTVSGNEAITGTLTASNFNAASTFGFKNRIINGDMRIDQRNSGASTTPTSSTYSLDRWISVLTAASKFSVQQNASSVTPPTGFTNYLGVTSLSAYSVPAGDFLTIAQKIEGYNIADLDFGKSTAKTITISFWVRSSITGTLGACLTNGDTTRSYPFTYTISAANTWEQKTVTIAGDTSGTWATTTSAGMGLHFGLAVGSTYSGAANSWSSGGYYGATGVTNTLATNGATLYITGVQLEVGSKATTFDTRAYGQELALCQRYLPMYTNSGNNATAWLGSGAAPNTTAVEILVNFPVTPRVPPTGLTITAAASNYKASDTAGSVTVSGVIFGSASNAAAQYELTCTGATAFRPYVGYINASLTEYKLYFTGCEL
jgi:hypothetical protein